MKTWERLNKSMTMRWRGGMVVFTNTRSNLKSFLYPQDVEELATYSGTAKWLAKDEVGALVRFTARMMAFERYGNGGAR